MRGKRLLFKTFSMLDRAGVHVMPKHYYTPVPDCAWLKDNESLWIGRSSLTGIHWDLAQQFAWLKDVCDPYYGEVAGLKPYYPVTQNGSGRGYGEIESQVLHCFVRRYAPANIIEIGSGVSTMCMLEAPASISATANAFRKSPASSPSPARACATARKSN
jgi:hypothetical protein